MNFRNLFVLASFSVSTLIATSHAFAEDKKSNDFSFGGRIDHRTMGDSSDVKGNLTGIFLQYERVKTDSLYFSAYLDVVSGNMKTRNGDGKIKAASSNLNLALGYNIEMNDEWIMTPYLGFGSSASGYKVEGIEFYTSSGYQMLGLLNEYSVNEKLSMGADLKIKFVSSKSKVTGSVSGLKFKGSWENLGDSKQLSLYLPVKYKLNSSWKLKAAPFYQNSTIGEGDKKIKGNDCGANIGFVYSY